MPPTQVFNKSGAIKTGQIIVLAMVGGILAFGAIVIVISGPAGKPLPPGAIVSLILAAFGLLMLGLRLILPGMVTGQACQRMVSQTDRTHAEEADPWPDDDPRLNSAFLTATIIGSAVLEGGAFANLVAFLLEGQIYSLVVAGILLVGILWGLPTRSSFENWETRQRRRIGDLRSMPRH